MRGKAKLSTFPTTDIIIKGWIHSYLEELAVIGRRDDANHSLLASPVAGEGDGRETKVSKAALYSNGVNLLPAVLGGRVKRGAQQPGAAGVGEAQGDGLAAHVDVDKLA